MQKTSAYLFNSNYEKSEKCNPTFQRNNFFPSSPDIDKSVSTQRFSQKREKISLSYPKLGIKVFVELWEIIHLKIWTHFSLTQMKLFQINLKHCHQTCSDDHPCKTTTRLRLPMPSPPQRIPAQSLLYKTTACLTRPATTFFVPQMRKSLSKTTTIELVPAKKWETNIRNNA